MSYTDDYLKLRKKRLEEEKAASNTALGPVRQDTVEEEISSQGSNSWFQKGAFEDGYQLGDISKTILGTVQDIGDNVNTAIVDATENLIDTTAYGVGVIGGLFNDEFQDNVGDFIAKDFLNSNTSGRALHKISSPVALVSDVILQGDIEGNSVLGEKADSLVQSGAHLVGSHALARLGVPAELTMGVNAFGSEIEQAYQNGATHLEAGISGAVSAGAEILFERLSGGIKLFKGNTLDDSAVKWLSQNISNKLVRTLAKFGLDVAGEGAEEVLTEAASALGRKLTYADEQEWEELFSSEDAWDAFVGGAVMSGVAGGGKLVSSSVTGRDFTTGLTENEQKVLDAVYEQEVAKAEEGGKKLSKEAKNEIYTKVETALKKGEISTDAIESALGGDTYKTYKDTLDSVDAIRKEYEELGKKENPTLADRSRYEKLEAQIKELESNAKSNSLKSQLSNEVFDKVKQKDNYLVESYNERARRSTAYKADLSKYDKKAAETVKKAIESGILNDSKRTHEFVDFVAKLSADKGVTFDFTNNQRLKDSGFAIKGATINGYLSKGGITVNIESDKALNSIVGHEITHVLEGTKLYDEMRKAVFEYAKSKGEYESRKKALEKLYKKGTDIDAELTADLIGDYLFTDEDFVKHLHDNHRNIFQKIYAEIKSLLKIATADSKEARQLEKVKRAFDKAYRESVENKKSTNTKFALERVGGIDYVRAEKNIFIREDGTLASEREVFNSLVGKTISLPDGEIKIVKRLAGKDMYNELSKRYPKLLNGVDDAKQLNSDVNYNMEELISNSKSKVVNKPDINNRHAKQGIESFDTRTVKFFDGEKAYNIEFSIATLQNGEKIAYAKKYFGYDAELTKKIQTAEARSRQSPLNQRSAKHSLSQTDSNVNRNFENSSEKNDIKIMEGGSVAKYSLSTWTPETQTNVKNNLIKRGYDSVQVNKWIADTNSVAAIIAENKDRLDFVAADNQVMLKHNDEYIKTLDASTLCAKRLVYQGTFDAIQHRMPNTMLSSDDLIDLLNMMKERGIQTPCGVCYVESRRRHLGKFAQEWLNSYEGEYKPNLDEVTTSDGLERLRKTHPQTYKDFVDAMNKKGSSNPKVVQLRTEYRNEIMNLTPSQIKKIEAIGGLRVQSFSDFETPHMLDMMQAVMDMSAMGLHSQAYTKVPNFAWVFGDTGIKINLSLIAEGNGFDANGNLIFSSTEGMDIDEALALRERYSQNVGTIVVGANDEHILACMADDRIDFIIPFHRSGWGMKELEMMGMDSYTDYTYGQKEHDLTTGKGLSNLYPPDYWDYTVSGKENAERYLNLCATTGREPKFSKFLVNNGDGSYSLQPDGSTDGYWKMLIDFKMYDNDGNGAEQQIVQPNFNMEEAYRVLEEYDGNANELPIAKDVVDDFVEKYTSRYPEQIKNIDNKLPTSNPDIRYSLSAEDKKRKRYGNYNVFGDDIRLDTPISPLFNSDGTTMDDVVAFSASKTSETLSDLEAQHKTVNQKYFDALKANDTEAISQYSNELIELERRIAQAEVENISPLPDDNERKQNTSNRKEKERTFARSATDSDAVDGKVLFEDLNQEAVHYQPISNKKTLGNANARLDKMGYEQSVSYFNHQFENKSVSLDDVALGERLIQEAIKRGDNQTAGALIEDVAILGTELGQKVQALSIIKRLTPEGQLRMLNRVVERGKNKNDKAYQGVEITQEMIDKILNTYNEDGSYNQDALNAAVESVKQEIADQMDVSVMDKVNDWRYLSMLGNPKTHIRNLVSNMAMQGTVKVKNALARTIETFAPIENKTKTWKKTSSDVKAFAKQTAIDMQDVISGDGKYDENTSIKQKRKIFKNKILNRVYGFNSDLLSKEDWWFSKAAFTDALSEYLTANGIQTEQDIQNNAKLVEKAKQYAIEQSQIATFRQYSWLANQISNIERKNVATQIAVGAVLPFKKTPINIAKTALNYSPLGFAKTLTYDMHEVKNGRMEASQLIDHLSQNLTGSALVLAGYMLASMGVINGAGSDDKEGEYDYQLGEQAYSINIGDATYSLSWLSPIAMPLFVGANAYEQLVEGKEWNGDVVVETLAQTLDPLSEMSFLSSLDDVLSSYDSGVEKFAGIAESASQSYLSQFIPTLSSQIATVMDDKKRSTKVASDSDFKFFDETINKLKYKIPYLRQTLEPSTDIWGNEIKQSENFMKRAVETFIAPYAKREDISTSIDEELKTLYRETGEDSLIPSIPYNYINYKGEKYEMSASDFTEYKQLYGQGAYEYLSNLMATETYKNASYEDRAAWVDKVYDLARDEAKKAYFAKYGVEYTNAKKDGQEYYKENSIKGAIKYDMTPDEYDYFVEYPKKYALSQAITSDFATYKSYASALNDLEADKNSSGESISGSRKNKVIEYINGLDIGEDEKIMLYKSEYNSDNRYNHQIIDYLNSREDISYEQMKMILEELGFTVRDDGTIKWD